MIGSRQAPRANRVGTRARAATAAVAVAVVAAGCAAVPTSGAVEQFGGTAQFPGQQDYSQPIAEPPGPGWSATQIVTGFVAANASFASDHEVAREYLDGAAQRTWKPGPVKVLSGMTTGAPVSYGKQFAASQPGGYTRVVVTGLRVATLTALGQSLVSSGSPKQSFSFTLIKNNGQWRIINPPPYLLLTQPDFQRVYQPRNLYFLAGSGQTLVPDPVFVPQQDTNAQLATGLATALLQDPKGWLQGAARTGFPRNSYLRGQVKINGPNAIVDLGGKASTADRSQQEQMAAQLAWTLASGPTPIQSVELEINGRPLQIAGSPLQLLGTYSDWVPTPSAGSSLYYIGSGGTVQALSGVGPPGTGHLGRVTPVTGAGGTPRVPPLRSIAVSPNGRWIAGISEGGKVVYAWDLTSKAALRQWPSSSGACTSLSWDQHGDLWITAGGSVWMLPAGKDSASPVPTVSPAGDNVTAFRVASDGVRAVMIVNGTQLQLVAIIHPGSPSVSLGVPVAIGSGITDPEALTWYDANNVIVLDRGSSGGQLDEVPLNGGQPIPITSEGNIVSVTATSPSGPSPNIAVGLSGGQIMVSANLGAFESTHATGQAPVYPG
jgi:Lipoprotein LpqB beta-propeller domain/Sporulation and spore germination